MGAPRGAAGNRRLTAAPTIIVVTGASGVGKTTLVRALESQHLPGLHCYYYDSVGVPSPAQMVAEYGSAEAWQQTTTDRWMARLAANEPGARTAVLDGQIRPSELQAAFTRHGVARSHILLIDCDHEARDARLRDQRRQPELATPRMAAWAAYLRGQADALHLPILDTTAMTQPQTEQAFIERIRAWHL